MNTAARLEGANKPLETALLVSREAAPFGTRDDLRAMGRIGLRGRATPVEVYEIKPGFPPEACARLNAAYERFDRGDLEGLAEIDALATEYPDDAALRNLISRLERVGPGGAFLLD
jgi:adenylate cyclase